MSYEADRGISLDVLAHEVPNEDLLSVWIEGVNPATGYSYDYVFVFDHPKGQYIKLNSEKRESFLHKGTEQEAQAGIGDVTQQTRRLSGGAIDVHPFYGAVWGNKTQTVAPDFLTDLEELDRNLTMFVNLTDMKDKFDDSSTRESLAIGTTVAIPGTNAARLLAYMKAHRANPNQAARDQAIANDLGQRWDDEFRRVNPFPRFGRNRVPKAMEMSPANIANLLHGLGQRAVLSDIAVTQVFDKSRLVS